VAFRNFLLKVAIRFSEGIWAGDSEKFLHEFFARSAALFVQVAESVVENMCASHLASCLSLTSTLPSPPDGWLF
jgi:hypothetical protein